MNIRLLTVTAVIFLVCMASGCVSDNDGTGGNASVDDNSTATQNTGEQTGNTDNAEVTNSDIAIGTMTAVTHSFSENDSQSTVYAIIGDLIIVELEENPTTGYSWNMTYSKGLEVQEDAYTQASANVSLVGAGGSHTWIFEVTDTGEQSISGIYVRPWEEVTGNEDSYELTIEVIPESELITDTGTVTYNDLEGGFYGIVGTDDAKYDTMNLPAEFSTDGTEVRFTAYTRDDMMSFHMWGQIIELRTISPVL
nr:protease inhibitor I42 family protein [uncultured Methanolobus sp.]